MNSITLLLNVRVTAYDDYHIGGVGQLLGAEG
jgi:hypothetical protein